MKNLCIISVLLQLILISAACSEDVLDINTDPNNPTEVQADLILPVAQKYSAYIQESYEGQNKLGNYMMYNWSQSYGYLFITTEFYYNVTSSFYNEIFDYTYSKVLKQYEALKDLEGEKYGNYHAISAIMQCYHFQILVDSYGDVPYFETLQRGEQPTPVYDDGLIIYKDLLLQLSNAIALINATNSNTDISPLIPGEDDTMFQGDMNLWKTFANTLKLRILVRMSDLEEEHTFIKNEFDQIAEEGSGFLTTDAIVQMGYVNEQNKMNPKWEKFGEDLQGNETPYNKSTCATQYLIDFLSRTNDPRIDFIYEKPESGHLGVEQGEEGEQFLPEFVSNLGPGILKAPSQASILYTASECYFNQSEAALKGLMTGDAKSYYELGIEASFNYLGTGDANSYYSQNLNLVGWDASENKQETIITQKWIATNSIDAIQSWFDYSRTGYPSNLPISTLASTTDRPVRLAYPSSEVTSNGENLPEQPDVFNSKVFWAK